MHRLHIAYSHLLEENRSRRWGKGRNGGGGGEAEERNVVGEGGINLAEALSILQS